MIPTSPRIPLFGRHLLITFVAGLLLVACQAPHTDIPASVTKESRSISLAGKVVTVDFYLPKNLAKAPVIVVAHGFTRNRHYMAGWGVLLAKNGFTAAVLDQPYWADHARNGKAIAELLQQIQSGAISLQPKPEGHTAVVGMSMGGLTTLLATSQVKVDAWLGLDTVDSNSKGAAAARNLGIPAAVLLAEPSSWNAHGNARDIIAAFPNPPFVIKVRGASHCDTESPTDLAGGLVTGGTSIRRLAVYEEYLLAFFKSVFQHDAEALKKLDMAKQDARVLLIEPSNRK